MTPAERLDRTLELLASIDRSLKILVSRSAPATVEPPLHLDGKYGDPVVKVDPRDWSGDSMKGKHLSECPPPYLDQLAELYEFFAMKAEQTGEEYNGKPTAPYKRRDAARARGWARRLRQQATGRTPPKANGTSDWTDADSEWPGPEPF